MTFLKSIAKCQFLYEEACYHLQGSEAFCWVVFLFCMCFFEWYLCLWPVGSLDGQLLLISTYAAICYSLGRENRLSFQEGEELPPWGCSTGRPVWRSTTVHLSGHSSLCVYCITLSQAHVTGRNDLCPALLFLLVYFAPAGRGDTCRRGKFNKFISIPCAGQNP